MSMSARPFIPVFCAVRQAAIPSTRCTARAASRSFRLPFSRCDLPMVVSLALAEASQCVHHRGAFHPKEPRDLHVAHPDRSQSFGGDAGEVLAGLAYGSGLGA